MNPQILYDIFEKVAKRRGEGKDVIKLNVGEAEQSPPKILFSAINRSLKSGRTGYGPAAGTSEIRELLAKQHGVSKENILIGPGSKFLIYATLKILTENETAVTIPLPSWSTFNLMFKDLKINKINYLKTTEENKWQITKRDLEKIESGVIIITNPNNPTSTLFDFEQILTISKKKKVLIIKDCAYEALVFNKRIKTKVDLTNTIEIHSFSKKFCITGFRIGYLIANEEIVRRLTYFMQITISCVPLFIQDGVVELLNKQVYFPRKLATIYEKRANMISKMLKNCGISFVKPDAGFYIFANCHQPTEKLCLNLLDKGVAVVPGTAFGPYPTYIRISLTEKDNSLIKGVEIILDYLKKSKKMLCKK